MTPRSVSRVFTPGPVCQYCLADPRYTTLGPDPERRCPVCGADYCGPRRGTEYRMLLEAGLIARGDD